MYSFCCSFLQFLSFLNILSLVQAEISRLDPFIQAVDTGILGRLADSLTTEKEDSVNIFSVDSTMAAIEGKQNSVVRAAVNSELGFRSFNPSGKASDKLNDYFHWINGEQATYSSMFAKTWSSLLVSATVAY